MSDTHTSPGLMVILGSGRSGTSVVARMTRVFGYALGDNLKGADAGNAGGYFEDRELLSINESLIALLGLVNHTAKPLAPHWLDSSLVVGYQRRAERWLSRRLQTHHRFCMKDPRVSRLLPFWQRVFDAVGVTPDYIVAHRHPLTSAASLCKEVAREGGQLGANRALRSLLARTAALAGLEDPRVAVCDYDRLLTAPGEQARSLARALDQVVDEAALEAFEQFVSPALNTSSEQAQAFEGQVHPALARAAHAANDLMARIDNAQVSWSEARPELTSLARLCEVGLETPADTLWVTLLGEHRETAFDKAAIQSADSDTHTHALFIRVGEGLIDEAQQARIETYLGAGVSCELMNAPDAHQAAVMVMRYLEEVAGLYARVRLPDLMGLGAYPRMLQNAHAWPDPDNGGFAIRIDSVGGTLSDFDRAERLPADVEVLVRDALESSAVAVSSRSTQSEPVNPLVSICIAHRNRPHLLEQALSAVRGQTYANIEILVLDDGSDLAEAKQAMAELSRQSKRDERLRVFKLKHGFLDRLKNVAARHARGDYVYFVDDDDIPLPYAVEHALAAARATGADVVTCGSFYFQGDDMPSEPALLQTFYPIGPTLSLAPFTNSYGGSQALFRTRWLREIPFTEQPGVAYEDWEWYVRAHLAGAHIVLLPEPLYWYRVSDAGLRLGGDKSASLRRVIEPFIEAGSHEGGIVRLAQGLHHQTQHQHQQIQQFAGAQDHLKQALDDTRPVLERDTGDGAERFMRATSPVEKDKRARVDVAIVMPALTGPAQETAIRRLRETLASLLMQWHGPERIALIDTNAQQLSMDCVSGLLGSPGLGSGLVRHYHILDGFETEPMARKSAALNQAVEDSHADYLYVIYAGDRLAPDGLFRLSERLGGQSARLAYTDEIVKTRDEGTANRGNSYALLKKAFNAPKLRCSNFLGCSVVYHRQSVIEAGGFSTDLAWASDYDMALRLSETGAVAHVDEPVYERHNGGHIDELHMATPGENVFERVQSDALKALRGHLARTHSAGQAHPGSRLGTYQVLYPQEKAQPVSFVIWVHTQVELAESTLESLLNNVPLEAARITLASPDKASEAVKRFFDMMAADPVSEELGMRFVTGVGNFSELAGALDTRFAVFLNEGAQVLNATLMAAMRGLNQDFGAVLFAPNLLTQRDGELRYHSSGCSLLLNHDEAEGRIFAGQRVNPEASPDRMEREPELDAWVGAPAFDAFGFMPGVFADTLGRVPVDEAMPARLSLAAQAGQAGAYRCIRASQANLYVVDTPELNPRDGRNPNTRGALSASMERAYQMAWGQPDPVGNKNLNATSAEMVEPEPVYRMGGEKRAVPRVIALAADQEGCGHYRIISPMRNLVRANLVEGGYSQRLMTLGELVSMAPDSLILQRQLENHQIERIRRINACFPHVFKVFEIDDLINELSIHNAHRKHIHDDVLKRMRKAISLCDRLVVTTDYLAERYERFANEVVIAPNCLDTQRWSGLANTPRLSSDRPRVGWAGGVSHTADLMEMRTVIQKTSDYIDWVFLGMCPDELMPYVEYHEPAPTPHYPAKLASLELDLAIAPVADNAFNRAKSNLKVLEYGMLGIPVVASDRRPYNVDNFPIELARGTSAQWIEAITEAVKDRQALIEKGQALREHILAHWTMETRLEQWQRAWLAG